MEDLQINGEVIVASQPGAPAGSQVSQPGRRTKLTPEVVGRLCAALSVGATRKDAAILSGISYETFRRWMNRGEQDVHDAEAGLPLESGRPPEVKTDHAVFCMAILKAEATIAMRLEMVIYDAALNDPFVALKWLERRYPAEWGLNRITSAGILRKLSTEQLLDLMERLDALER